jgi:GT2 family glycosyltransferase
MQNLAIVIPVYNGADELRRCLASLALHRTENSEILLVDDASPDPQVLPILREFEAANAGVRVIASEENRGFIATSNLGARQASPGADLLFLNTDTEVTAGWADEMRLALEADPRAGVCCPLSNNATILSVPRFQQETPLSFGLDAGHMAALVQRAAGAEQSVAIPTPVGFCMLVKRDAWEDWGPFDTAFGRGYGEEDDFGQKLQATGRRVICALRAFVFHKGAASFGSSPEVSQRKRRNGELLASRWPDYNTRTKAWCRENPLRHFHERLWQTMLSPQPDSIHVLHVMREWRLEGGARDGLKAIVRATGDSALHTVLVPMPDTKGAWMDAIDFEFDRGFRVVGLLEFEARFPRFLAAIAPTVVHFHGSDWVAEELRRQAHNTVPTLVTPAETAEPERCAALYQRAAAGQ